VPSHKACAYAATAAARISRVCVTICCLGRRMLAMDQDAASQDVMVFHRCQWLQILDPLRVARMPKCPANATAALIDVDRVTWRHCASADVD